MSAQTRDWFMERAAAAVPFLIDHFDPQTGRFHPKQWEERYNNVIYALAYLYRTKHPLNPHHGSEHLLQSVLAGARCYVDSQNEWGEWPHGPSGGYCLAEWPAYYLVETLVLLGDGLSDEDRKAWEETITRYVTHACRRPFSFTSPSSEAWKCLVLFRAGQALQRDEWCAAGRHQMRQLNKTQTPAGYWDEPLAGQGPSPAYHHLHLGALALYANCSRDAYVEVALDNALRFALAASYPNGTPLACLDGRAALSPEAALSSIPALARTAAGRQLVSSLCSTLDELRSADRKLAFSSTWGAFIEPCFLADAHRHYGGDAEQQAAEPELSATGETLGASATLRNAAWFGAMCAEVSDTALLLPQRSTFERQSRVSLWHDDWGIVVGGGSQARTTHLSPANVVLATDFREVGCAFGEVRSLARYEPDDPTEIATAYHSPRHASVERTEQGLRLCLVYGHGDVTIELRPVESDTCEVVFTTQLHGVKSAACQLPLLLTHHTRVGSGAGLPQPIVVARSEWFSREIDDSLVLTRPDRDARVIVERPRDSKMKFHAPIHAGYGRAEDENFEPAFALGLLSAQISQPEGENVVTFRIRVERVE